MYISIKAIIESLFLNTSTSRTLERGVAHLVSSNRLKRDCLF